MKTIIDWMKIDTVLLDMDGTLLDLHYDNYFWMTHLPKRYAEIHNIETNEAEAALSKNIRQLEGTLHWYCLDYWSDTLQIDIGQLKTEIKHKIQERPYTQAFLQFLKEQDKTIALATNSHPMGTNIKLAQTHISHYFDHTVSSHQFQHPKEDQAFCQCLNQHLNQHFTFEPERTLLIDDNPAILDAAKTYGIAHTLGIHQPDSHIHRRLEHRPAIYHFDEIMPVITEQHR